MVRLIIFALIVIFSFNLKSEILTSKEKIILNFVDLDRDRNISLDEANKLIQLIFKLIDKDLDSKISELEIIELKNLIKSL